MENLIGADTLMSWVGKGTGAMGGAAPKLHEKASELEAKNPFTPIDFSKLKLMNLEEVEDYEMENLVSGSDLKSGVGAMTGIMGFFAPKLHEKASELEATNPFTPIDFKKLKNKRLMNLAEEDDFEMENLIGADTLMKWVGKGTGAMGGAAPKLHEKADELERKNPFTPIDFSKL